MRLRLIAPLVIVLALALAPVVMTQAVQRKPEHSTIWPDQESMRYMAGAILYLRAANEEGGSLRRGLAFSWPPVMITDASLISGAAHVYTCFIPYREERESTVSRVDQKTGLAFLTCPWTGDSDWIMLHMFGLFEPQPGDTVYAVGDPESLKEMIGAGDDALWAANFVMLTGIFRSGTVSGHRTLPDGESYLELSFSVPGDASGGPLISEKGLVVGVVVTRLVNGKPTTLAVPLSRMPPRVPVLGGGKRDAKKP